MSVPPLYLQLLTWGVAHILLLLWEERGLDIAVVLLPELVHRIPLIGKITHRDMEAETPRAMGMGIRVAAEDRRVIVVAVEDPGGGGGVPSGYGRGAGPSGYGGGVQSGHDESKGPSGYGGGGQ